MIKIAICDDDEIVREEIKRIVSKYLREENISFSIQEFTDGCEITGDYHIDILFLDVEMTGMDGITVKNKLCEDDIQIVFVTSHEECMPEAFGKNVCGFVQKPICEEKLKNELDDMVHFLSKRQKYLVIEDNRGMHRVAVTDITYIESAEKYSHIHTINGDKFFSDTSLGDWEKQLAEEDFFRCHRKYLVGFWTVRKITEHVVFLNGDEVEFSRRNKESLKQSYRQFILRNAK